MSERVTLSGAQETMLITVYARARESASAHPVLHDPWAQAAIEHVDHDFGKFGVDRAHELTISLRARKFDLWTQRFLEDNPCATVIYLGCGLDARVLRVNPPPCARWYDVDFPEVIDLRRRLYPEPQGDYRAVGSPLEDMAWLSDVPADQPAFVMAEGVTMYLTEELVSRILTAVVDHFPSGEVAFDAHNAGLVRWMNRRGMTVRETGAAFSWGMNSPQDAIALEPRLEFVEGFRSSQLAEFRSLSLAERLGLRFWDAIPIFRGLHRPLLYRFPGHARHVGPRTWGERSTWQRQMIRS